jgi:hypothetical protein
MTALKITVYPTAPKVVTIWCGVVTLALIGSMLLNWVATKV